LGVQYVDDLTHGAKHHAALFYDTPLNKLISNYAEVARLLNGAWLGLKRLENRVYFWLRAMDELKILSSTRRPCSDQLAHQAPAQLHRTHLGSCRYLTLCRGVLDLSIIQ
jgi:hypothetical protein